MESIQLYDKDGRGVDLASHPSLLALCHAQNRSLNDARDLLRDLEIQMDDLAEREKILLSLGQSVQGVRSRKTRMITRINETKLRIRAYEANYIEVPNPAGDAVYVDGTSTDLGEWQWGDQLPSDTPTDVLRAIKHAKDLGVFEEFRIAKPRGKVKVDPMVYGVAGGACFYVGSWR